MPRVRRPDLSVRAWLGVGFGTAGFLLAALVTVAVVLLGRIEAAERRQRDVIAPTAEAAGRLEREVLRYAIRARTYALTGEARDLDEYRESRERTATAYDALDARAKEPDGVRVFSDVGPLLAAYLETGDAFVAARAAGRTGEVEDLEDPMGRRRDAVIERVIAYAELQRRKNAEQSAAIIELRDDAERVLLLALGAVIVLLGWTAGLVTRSIQRPVKELVAAARHVGAGEYGCAAALHPGHGAPPARNELAQLKRAFGAMATDLRERETRIAAQNEELQAQNEELQAQQEELQTQNEELQTQNEELQAQQEELQTQAEEMQTQTEQLREQDTRLREAMESVAEADRRKSEFLAMLSHELRNPLAPIVTGLHLLERADPASPQARRARETIARQVTHLARLVDDLLDLTRISRGKIRLERRRVDLVSVVRQAVEDHGATVAARGVALHLSVSASAPLVVEADPARITQVVGNLLSNAAKFTPVGGRVDVEVAAREAGAARRAAIRIRDSGVGIPPEVLPHLFQPFMQAETSLARTRGGLGLGLALVKALVELHGGTVQAASDGDGKGAEFTIELPLESAPAPASGPPAGARVAPRRVLVVEDNVDAAASLADLLRLDGHEVDVAHDGAQALRKARSWRPHVVLCDLGLPVADGYEVARQLRQDPALSGVFLVALTGYALPDDVQRARDAGFDEHLTKPAAPEEVAGVLSRASGAPVT